MGEQQAKKTHIRVLLTEEELQLPAIDDLCNKYMDWLALSKESVGGRKTRSANRRVDTIYEEIMAFKLPPIRIKTAAPSPSQQQMRNLIQGTSSNNSSAKSSFDGSEGSSRASTEIGGRTLRPRSRTPSGSRQQQAIPATPTQQRLRAAMKKTPDSANVLSAALNQQHPSVSVTKIRQLLRADSAQKKREEERERAEQIRQQRKEKEERAELLKRQQLEQRTAKAKTKREERLAEVRKARERHQQEQQLLKEEQAKRNRHNNTHANDTLNNKDQLAPNRKAQNEQVKPKEKPKPKEIQDQKKKESDTKATKEVLSVPATPSVPTFKAAHKTQAVPIVAPTVLETKPKEASQPPEQPVKQTKANETFQKNTVEMNNIDISVCDETTDEQRKHPQPIASWAKAPGLRDAIVGQFSQDEYRLLEEAKRIFGGVKLPVALDEIFGPNQAVINRYLCRTSSAVWSTPHRPIKRTSSDVFTPTDPKRC